jgi:hypothetical protein
VAALDADETTAATEEAPQTYGCFSSQRFLESFIGGNYPGRIALESFL